MSGILQDLRFTLRMLAKSPGFTIVACLTLALGIGATTAIFSLVDAVMLRPFNYPNPERLVVAWETNLARNINIFTCSVPNYLSWAGQQTNFEDLGAFETRSDNRTDGQTPERIQTARASSAFFRALGIHPSGGRFFLAAEDEPANRFVAVLGNQYWRERFNSDPEAIGQTLTINGERYAIVGIAPPMRAPLGVDVWRPIGLLADQVDRGDHYLNVVGRLKAGRTLQQAQAELQAISANLEEQYPETNKGWSVRLESMFHAFVAKETRQALTVLLAAVGLLLLIACANVASLLLARATGRYREVAIRQALGAGRWRIIRQLLAESLVLAAAGGIAGVLIAVWSVALLASLPVNIPALAEARVDGFVLLFAVAVSVATGVLFGLAPALQTASISVFTHLKEGGRSASASLSRQRLRQFLVAGEIALALVLLCGAGLLFRSFERMQRVDLGFAPENVFTAKVGLYGPQYEDRKAYVSFLDRLLESTAAIPGIQNAGMVSSAPFDPFMISMNAMGEQDAADPNARGVQTQWRVVGGDFFQTLRIPLLRGRLFQPGDSDGPRVAIISRNLAERLWPGQDPIGRNMMVSDNRTPNQIVGVVEDIRSIRLTKEPAPTMYFYYRQFSWRTMTLTLRSASDAQDLTAAVTAKVAELDPEQPLFDVRMMDDLIGRSAADPQMNMALLGLFAMLALVLAAIGIYGVMSYSVEQRTNEIGLRMALGAQPTDLLRLVLAQGMGLVAAGIFAGFLGALAATRVLSSLLFETSPSDPGTFLAVVLILAIVAALACYVPVRRAMKIDPMQALRHE